MRERLPLSALLAGPALEPELYVQLLGDETPAVELETLVEELEGLVLGLGPRPALGKFIV